MSKEKNLKLVRKGEYPWPGLPKWPALVVSGTPVKPSQAAEIIIRTDGAHFCGNDKDWERQLCDAAGIKMSEGDWAHPEWDSVQAYREKYKLLDLGYMCNSQIYSAWIGGPHGWCDWDGNIGTKNYNIGKWPESDEVHRELEIIAAAFPYLNMRVQLFNEEACDSPEIPVIEYRVESGEAWPLEPNEIIEPPQFDVSSAALIFSLSVGAARSKRERGCSIEQYRTALAQLCPGD